MTLNTDLVKYLLVLALAPFWVPVARALWSEFRDAMREEGGLSGPPPGPQERKRITEERRQGTDPLIHEPLAGRNRPVPGMRSGAGGRFRRIGGPSA